MCFVFEKQKKIRPHTFTLRTGFPRARAPQNGITKQSKICILARGKIESERKKNTKVATNLLFCNVLLSFTRGVCPPCMHQAFFFFEARYGWENFHETRREKLGNILQKMGSSFWFIWFSWLLFKKFSLCISQQNVIGRFTHPSRMVSLFHDTKRQQIPKAHHIGLQRWLLHHDSPKPCESSIFVMWCYCLWLEETSRMVKRKKGTFLPWPITP